MTTQPLARLSRIAFYTDMTLPGAPVIPLGFMIEAVVPARARWLGIIGRSSLTPLEEDAVNLQTWKGLKKPFEVLLKSFEVAWKAEAGSGGDAAAAEYFRSALSITTEDRPAIAQILNANSNADWVSTRFDLLRRLEEFDRDLAPPPELIVTPTPIPQPARTPTIGDLDSRQRQGELRAA